MRVGYACPVCESHRAKILKPGEWFSWITCTRCYRKASS